MWVNRLYYYMKPAVPRPVQISIRRHLANKQLRKSVGIWPIDHTAGEKPDKWPGWPDGKQFALVLTHDVDTAAGQENCIKLKNLEKNLGLKSSFNFVPERYPVSAQVLNTLNECGFEVGVHGLNHDGKLYNSRRLFLERAVKINKYLNEWGAVGFRSPSMHHNLDWIHALDIEYDSSTFDTDPFEPQSDGVRTIFPFWVEGDKDKRILEIPYTLPQDFSIFILLKNKTIDVWKNKLQWICQKGGAAVLNVHPDYMRFDNCRNSEELYDANLYSTFLEHVVDHYRGQYWLALPREVNNYFRSNPILNNLARS